MAIRSKTVFCSRSSKKSPGHWPMLFDWGSVRVISTIRPGSGKGRLCSSSLFRIVNAVVLIPIPMASVTREMIVNPGLLRSCRMANFTCDRCLT